MKSDDVRLKNLKPFQKGHPPSGGRPKGSLSFTTILKKALQGKINGSTIAELIVAKFIAKALAGDMPAIKELLDRIDGKVKQPVENSGELTINYLDALKELK